MKMMLKLFLVLSVAACGLAQNKDNADNWQDLYDSQWYDEEIEKLGLDSFEWGDSKDIDGQNTNIKNAGSNELGNDEKDAEEDTSQFDVAEQSNQSKEVDQETVGSVSHEEPKPENGNYKIEDTNDNDYVLEDNRFTSEEKLASDENLTDKEPETIDLEPVDEIKESIERKNDKIDDYVVEDNRLLYKDEIETFNTIPVVNEENVDSTNTEDETEKIVDVNFEQKESGEFQNHLSNKNEQESIDDESEPDMDKDKSLQDAQIENSTKEENIEGNQKILEETKQLSATIDSSSGNSNEDNVDKKDDDLDYDLNELFKTFDKLSQDAQVETQKPLFEVDKPEAVQGEIADYEEKYGRPYNEGSILKMRQDYEDSVNNQDNWDDYQISSENQQNHGNDEQDDLNIDTILKKLDKELEQDADDDLDRDKKKYENDALLAKEDAIKSSDSVERQDVAKTDDDDANIKKVAYQFSEEDSEPQPVPVKKMTSSEMKSSVGKLTNSYVDELDINSDSFDRNVAPVHITLKSDEAVEITSPDYPEFYPTNNIIDWIFEGDGMGIELNISDLSLNGFTGDYLLVKPGGIDYTGQDGLVFSFHLNGERRYRFLDVNRMFVRFRAHPGMPFARGFKLSVRLVGPRLELPEPIPTPTPAPELPQETLTIFFEGLVAAEFRNRSEEFRSIISDMATMYINRHGVDPGYESTTNVTQITRIAECNINWPGHEPCAAVTFGVPLDYDEDQDYRLTKNELEYMWFSYSYVDPFASRLRRMGLSEFAIPNEGTVIMAWVVIFFGVLISALMLGFAVWRWNCFEGYSRMPMYTDTDSIISGKKKDDLDLYPTPHQNLPPLYSDGQYEDRWSGNAQYDNNSRVDMGGFSNKSYVRENELVDIDSDDDVIMALPGQKDNRTDGLTITSKHIFEV